MCRRDFTDQQLEMLDRFKSLKVGALFSQMGTGKTRVAVELVNYNNPDLLVYVCPFSCKANVEAELIKWDVKCRYIIVGYETLSASSRVYAQILAEMQKCEKCFIIADESIFIKKGTTKRFMRCCQLRHLCEWALVLNGTPIVNNERDIYNQMEFLSHKIFDMTYGEFMKTFFIEHVFRKGHREVHNYTFFSQNRPAFAKIIEPYVYQADLMFEHKIVEDVTWIPVGERYDDAKDRILNEYSGWGTDSIIAVFTTLATLSAEDYNKNCKVADYIKGRKCIVYCSRKREMKIISKHCGDHFMIDGATKDKDRKRIIAEFTASEDKPLILSFGVGAYSLNLQTANEIVYSSLTFNYGQYEQSMYRIKRMGQDSDIKYTYILPATKITEMMMDNLDDKAWLDEEIKRHINDSKEERMKWLRQISERSA